MPDPSTANLDNFQIFRPLCNELRNPIRRYLLSFLDLPEGIEPTFASAFYAEASQPTITINLESTTLQTLWRITNQTTQVVQATF